MAFLENSNSDWQLSALSRTNALLFSFLKEAQRSSLSPSLTGSISFSLWGRRSEKEVMEMERASGDSFNGLKFGERIYFEDVGGSGSSSKSIGAPAGKKGKGVLVQVGVQHKSARCQVEGCNLDLTGAKAYYCRHKVCGMHSKSPKVIVAGLEQRFCQQCSRFHLLPEFDQDKRSCRRRLAGHNERRRKQPPLGPSPSRYGRFSSFHGDNSRNRSFLMDFNYRRPPGVINQPLRFANPYPPALFSDSNCALSLLSTQPWGAASNLAAASRTNLTGAPVISGTTGLDGSGAQIAELNMTCSYMMNSPWDFKDDESGSSSLEMGLRHAPDTGHDCFSGELGLALQGPDDFGHHVVYHHDHHHQAMHWAL